MRSQKNSAFFSLKDQNYDAFTKKGNNELDLQSEVWFCMQAVCNPPSLRCRFRRQVESEEESFRSGQRQRERDENHPWSRLQEKHRRDEVGKNG